MPRPSGSGNRPGMDDETGPELSQGAIMGRTLRENIAAMRARADEDARRRSWSNKVADRITAFAGSMAFVFIHLAVYGGWIVANLGWIPGFEPWDPTFVVLAMIASVEAIFLSTFILISQNRQAMVAERRAELDLHVTLLAEHEITKIGQLLDDIAEKLGLDADRDPDYQEVKTNVQPVEVLDAIERSSATAGK